MSSSESFHMATNKIPANPKTGFTNVHGKGGMSIGYIEVSTPTDFTPLLKGLPGDLCNSPHWGYVLEGSMRVIYGDAKEETISAGEIFYMPAPHTVLIENNVKFIDFSPDEEFIPLMDHVAEKINGNTTN